MSWAQDVFVRGKRNRSVILTDEGMLLRRRAEEIVELTDKTEAEIHAKDEIISGDIYIGGGETDAMRLIAQTARDLQEDYPDICYHLFSGNADDVTERLDKGLLDFGILVGSANTEKYGYITPSGYGCMGVTDEEGQSPCRKKRSQAGGSEGTANPRLPPGCYEK